MRHCSSLVRGSSAYYHLTSKSLNMGLPTFGSAETRAHSFQPSELRCDPLLTPSVQDAAIDAYKQLIKPTSSHTRRTIWNPTIELNQSGAERFWYLLVKGKASAVPTSRNSMTTIDLGETATGGGSHILNAQVGESPPTLFSLYNYRCSTRGPPSDWSSASRNVCTDGKTRWLACETCGSTEKDRCGTVLDIRQIREPTSDTGSRSRAPPAPLSSRAPWGEGAGGGFTISGRRH